MNPLTMIAAWWRRRQERKARDARLLAVMVALKASMPGAEQPSEQVQQFVNRTLNRRVF